MIETILNSAKEKGAETEIISLVDSDIKHCTGCIICEETGECVISDDMKELLLKLESVDAIVLGSPSYYNNVTGLMKDFIDRTNPTWKDLKLKGKKAAICCTGSQNVKAIQNCTDILVGFAKTIKMKVVGNVTANDQHLHSKSVISELQKLGEKIASN